MELLKGVSLWPHKDVSDVGSLPASLGSQGKGRKEMLSEHPVHNRSLVLVSKHTNAFNLSYCPAGCRYRRLYLMHEESKAQKVYASCPKSHCGY